MPIDDSIFSGDPTRLMPRLRQIHKLSEFPTGYGPEDWDAMKQPPGKIKKSQGFEYAETGTNNGGAGGRPARWNPGKIKSAAGFIPGLIPGIAEQYYMQGLGATGDIANMPLELVSMAGPRAAQGAQMVEMAKRLSQRPNQDLMQRRFAIEADRQSTVQGLENDLRRLQMEEQGLIEGPSLLDRLIEMRTKSIQKRAHQELSKDAEAVIKTKLLPHQERVVEKIKDRPGLVVAHGLGSGKTLSSIAAAIRLNPDSTQVLVPASLRANYQKELSKHVSGDMPPIVVGSLQGAAGKGAVSDADLLIVDEAHRGRNPTSKTYQMIHGAHAGKRLLLTASPTYNSPADVAALVNMAAGDRILPMGASFDKKFIAKPRKGLLGLLPFTRKHPELKNKEELQKTLAQWVDYHESGGEGFPDVKEERYSVEMTPHQTALHDAAWGKLSFISKMRLQRGLPPEKQDLSKINQFQSQTRQISSTTSPYSKDEGDASPKVMKAVGLLTQAADKNPNHKALVYSNYLGTLRDYSRELESRDVPHAIFSGNENMSTRKKIVEDYNAGKLKALLVSSAGGEGLDLKGTRQVQVLEPHWNVEKLKQVEGRAIRRGSHTNLPEEEQNVVLQRFDAYPKGGFFGKRRGVEQVLGDMATNKERLNKSLLGLLEKQAYKLQGETEVQGIPIAIENRKGSVRTGTDPDGNEWRTKMKHPYGYIKGTKGVDGEPVDVYVGPDKEAPEAFVVHQHKDDGKGYDEDKVMLAFPNKAEAKKAYLAHYDDPKFLGPISRVSTERLKDLVASKKRLVKISQASYEAMLDELMTGAKVAGVVPPVDAAAQKRKEQFKLLRKAGPAIVGALGTGVGAIAGARRGSLLRGAITGLGTGATLGWVPDMTLNARDALKRYKKVTT